MSIFYHIILRTYCHATEVPEKVEKALRFVSRSKNITKDKLSGYYGNPIIVMETKLEVAKEFEDFFRSLGKAIIETLKEGLELRVDDERNFYMRFDKQKAFEEEYQLAEGEDTIATRCKLKVFPAEKAHAVLKLKEFLENL